MKAEKNRPQDKAVAETVFIAVRIQPRASKNEIVHREGGRLKVRLTAPPVDGAANEALVDFLSDKLSVSKSQIEIVSGHTSREKRIKISGVGRADVKRMLNMRSE